MKKLFWIALVLFMSMDTADVSAQSFLKNLEKTVKKEVKNRVTNEVNKELIYWTSSPKLGSNVRIFRALENEVALGSSNRRTTGYPIRPVTK